MKKILHKARAVLLPLLLVGGCTTAQAAALNIFACEPEWGALA